MGCYSGPTYPIGIKVVLQGLPRPPAGLELLFPGQEGSPAGLLIENGEAGAGLAVGRTGLTGDGGEVVAISSSLLVIKELGTRRLSMRGGRLLLRGEKSELVSGSSLTSTAFIMVVLALGENSENSWSRLLACMSS